MPRVLYTQEIQDVVDQLHKLKRGALDVPISSTSPGLREALSELERGVDVLKMCVEALKHRIGQQNPPKPPRPVRRGSLD